MARNTVKYKVLYFVDGMMPTEAQLLDAEQYGPYVCWRNAQYIDPEDTDGFEDCIAVTGVVPPNYARFFPAAVPLADYHAGKLGAPPETLEALVIPDEIEPPPAPTEDPFATLEESAPPRRRSAKMNAEWKTNGPAA